MPTFESKPFGKQSSIFARLAPKVRQRPVLFFGLPFIVTIVGASFGLSTLTQTRYDYNATKVKAMAKQDEIGLKADRRTIDIREEYFRLQAKEDELDDWEPKRIARPAGVPEWGVSPTSTIETEPLTSHNVESEKQNGISVETIKPSQTQGKIILGPDGKPCRACNSKLAFSAAMKGTKNPSTSTVKTTTTTNVSIVVECPPDGETLGNAAWTFLHSVAAYYPIEPLQTQQQSMLSLLKALPHVYPCHSCAESLGEEYQREQTQGGWLEKDLLIQQAVKSGPSLRKWLCGIHNEVNQRLGKPIFPCTEDKLTERWLQGPDDGRCN